MKVRKYLTKSNFKVGHECPTKLYYLNNPNFPSEKDDDLFLKSLADGGFQVGALAKIYFPDGVEVETLEHDKAVAETQELLKQDRVTIFEAAIRYQDFFIRIDVLEKFGNAFKIHEVKAKSWNASEDSFLKQNGQIVTEWEPYVADLAFQAYVLRAAYPGHHVTTFLMLADKQSKASVDGLNQRFQLQRHGNQTKILLAPQTSMATVGNKILTSVPADDAISVILNQEYQGKTFGAYIQRLADVYKQHQFEKPQISRSCGHCEYPTGLTYCWSQASGQPVQYFEQPLVFELWNINYKTRDKWLNDGLYRLSDLDKDDLPVPKESDEAGLSQAQRQRLQLELFKDPTKSPYFNAKGFSEEFQEWKFPLHFIDFETITAAIPFNKGMRPYETVAFQFSHHIVHEDGQIEHKNQFLSSKPGEFPNFQFVRELKKAIGKDEGTVFRYGTHENTVLKHIRRQLENSQEPDKDALIDFINPLIYLKDGNKLVYQGSRCMIDMRKLVLKYYLSVHMGGSNSIKEVLPSVLIESDYLQKKYSQPIYGGHGGIPSHNFTNHVWLESENGTIKDPYSLLGPVMPDFANWDARKFERFFENEELKEGGAASTAYARMQFTAMSDLEREMISKALLRYCELDTLAMVMIFEYWFDLACREGHLNRVA